jgi:hypothetical protein
MRRRVRWENVLRVVAAAVLAAVVVAWPRLAPPEPGLPGPEAAPLEAEHREPVPMGGDGRSSAPDSRARRRRAAGEERRRRAAEERERARRRSEAERRRAEARERRERRAVAKRRRVARSRSVEAAGGDVAARTDDPAPAVVDDDRTADPAQAEFGFERGG